MESSTMYDNNSISSRQTAARLAGLAVAAPIDADSAELTWVSLDRLRSAVVELSTALSESLRDERSSAVACLHRAQAMLHGVEGAPAQPSKNAVRQGLAPWQVRRVLAHIE